MILSQFLELSSSDYNSIFPIKQRNAKSRIKNIFNEIQHFNTNAKNSGIHFSDFIQKQLANCPIEKEIGSSRRLGIKVEDIICVPGASLKFLGEILIKYLYSNKSTGTKTGTIKRVLLLSSAETRGWQACFCRSVFGHFTRPGDVDRRQFPRTNGFTLP